MSTDVPSVQWRHRYAAAVRRLLRPRGALLLRGAREDDEDARRGPLSDEAPG